MLEHISECTLIDDWTARCIYEDGAALHFLKSIGIEQMPRLRRERCVNRDRLRRRTELIDGWNECYAESALDAFRLSLSLRVTYMHAKATRTSCNGLADAAKTDDAKLHPM